MALVNDPKVIVLEKQTRGNYLLEAKKLGHAYGFGDHRAYEIELGQVLDDYNQD